MFFSAKSALAHEPEMGALSPKFVCPSIPTLPYPEELHAPERPPALALTLSTEGSHAAGLPITVTATVHAHGEAGSFCMYNSPFDRCACDAYMLTGPNGVVAYRGETPAQRRPPGTLDQVCLAAGETKRTEFDLRDVYGSLPAGRYTLLFRGTALSRLPASDPIRFTVTSLRHSHRLHLRWPCGPPGSGIILGYVVRGEKNQHGVAGEHGTGGAPVIDRT